MLPPQLSWLCFQRFFSLLWAHLCAHTHTHTHSLTSTLSSGSAAALALRAWGPVTHPNQEVFLINTEPRGGCRIVCQDRQASLSSSWFNIDCYCDRCAQTHWHLEAQVDITHAFHLCPAYLHHSPAKCDIMTHSHSMLHNRISECSPYPLFSSLILLKPANSTNVQYNCVAVVCIF